MAISAGEVKVTLTMDAEAFRTALRDAGVELRGFGTETERTGDVAKKSGGEIARSQEDMAKRTTASAASSTASMKGLAVGISGTMTAGFALYQAFDNIEKKQYALEKATLAGQRADEAARKAKEDYDAAVTKYGTDSSQAETALTKLNIATEAANLADEKVAISQSNVNDQMTKAGLTLIPAVITGVDSMSRVWKGLKDLNIGEHLSGVGGALKGLGTGQAGPIGGALMGMGALTFAYMAFTSKAPIMKAAFSILTGALIALAMAQWAENIAAATGLSMTGVGAILVAAGVAAAIAMYALSSQYGAAPDESKIQQFTSEDFGKAAGGGGGGTTGGGGGGETGTYTQDYWAEQRRQEEASKAGDIYANPPEGLLLDFSFPLQMYKIPGEELWLDIGWLSAAMNQTYATVAATGIVALKAAWLRLHDPETGKLKEWHTDIHNDIWEGPQPAGYARGGWAGLRGPELAVLGERGPERVFSAEESRRIGNTNIFQVDGARDVDLVVSEIMRRLRDEGGTPY